MLHRVRRRADSVPTCPVCSEAVERGTGRYRIGDDEFHVPCFDQRRREADEEPEGALALR